MRIGSAVVELAVCLPVVFGIILGCIDACNGIFLKQTLIAAAYEGALVGSRPSASESDIVQHVTGVLAIQQVTGATVTVDGGGQGFDTLPAGKLFTVRIQANTSGNIPGPILLSNISVIEASVASHKQ